MIVGSDYTDVATPTELSVNARIAVNLGAPVVLSVRAKGRTPEQVAQVVSCASPSSPASMPTPPPWWRTGASRRRWRRSREALKRFTPKSYVLPEEPLLVAPTVADLQRAVDGTLISGDPELLKREVMGVLVAGMTAEHVLERLTDGVAVITPGDRSDVVLAVSSAHAAEGFPSLSTMILNGGLALHPSIAALVTGLGPAAADDRDQLGTFETASVVASTRGRVTATSQRKIDTALELMDSYVDTADLLAQLAIPIPTVVTPQMFTYQLLDRARADRKRIVLPEGEDDRILKAAGRLLQRNVAELTILGEEAQIRARSAELGVDLSVAKVLDPRTSELCDRFAEQYAELRKHKGVTVEQARETIHDVSYFGTMLVHNDMVDGMVSGAMHTTAHTVRPAFEIIKTQPGIVDSVQHLPDVPRRPGAGLRRLRDRARPDIRAAGRHRDLVGSHRGAVRHRPSGRDAVLLDRHVRNGCRRRQGERGNRTGARAATRSVGGRSHPVRRGRRSYGGGGQDARFERSRAGRRC